MKGSINMLYIVKAVLSCIRDEIRQFAIRVDPSSSVNYGGLVQRDALYASCYFISSDDMITQKEIDLISDISGEQLDAVAVSGMIVNRNALIEMIRETYTELKKLDLLAGTYNKRSSTAYQYIKALESFVGFVSGIDGVKRTELVEIKDVFQPFEEEISLIPA